MPVIKSAIKKLRQDRKHEKQNDLLRNDLRKALREVKKIKSGKSASKAISIIDKASKNNIIHKNKASRLKSSISKIVKPLAKSAKSASKPKSGKKTSKK